VAIQTGAATAAGLGAQHLYNTRQLTHGAALAMVAPGQTTCRRTLPIRHIVLGAEILGRTHVEGSGQWGTTDITLITLITAWVCTEQRRCILHHCRQLGCRGFIRMTTRARLSRVITVGSVCLTRCGCLATSACAQLVHGVTAASSWLVCEPAALLAVSKQVATSG
jgi:hypothetical protein